MTINIKTRACYKVFISPVLPAFILLSLLSMTVAFVEAADLVDDTKQIATLRKGTQLSTEAEEPEPLLNESNKDKKRERGYPMQPPTIPHAIDKYQVDTRANQCLACHARTRIPESQAPMISVTHFMDRDGNFLADVSPRRYFCTQCHVTQVDATPLVENTFIPIDQLLKKEKK